MTQVAKVLIVDDDIGMLETTAAILDAVGCYVAIAEDGFKAMEQARRTSFDFALIDIKMPGMNGVETYKEIKKIRPRTRVIMMTGYAVENLVKEALEEGVYGVFYKPLEMERIIGLIAPSP